jgi:hypothetical protein
MQQMEHFVMDSYFQKQYHRKKKGNQVGPSSG